MLWGETQLSCAREGPGGLESAAAGKTREVLQCSATERTKAGGKVDPQLSSEDRRPHSCPRSREAQVRAWSPEEAQPTSQACARMSQSSSSLQIKPTVKSR